MSAHTILLLPGDGIGPEVCSQVVRVFDLLRKKKIFDACVELALVGGASIDATGVPLTTQVLEKAKQADAVFLGAVGGPKWDGLAANERPEKGLLQLRSELGLYANFRPAMLYSSLVKSSSLREHLVSDLDMLLVRELTGGAYFSEPRSVTGQAPDRRGVNTMAYSEHEIVRIAKSAFEAARRRNKRLCSVDKANVLEVSQLWRDVVNNVAVAYPDIKLSHMYVDNAAMQLVRNPKQFDVLLTENMFGDILSDLAAMLTGSIGMLPSASLDWRNKGMYEPVHGSAPDIAGNNVANPLASILCIAMMVRYSFGLTQLATTIEESVGAVLADGVRTKDIAQKDESIVSTEAMGACVIQHLAKRL